MAKPANKSQRNKKILPNDFEIPDGMDIRATQWYIKGAEEGFLGKKNVQETVSRLIAQDAGMYFSLGYEAGILFKQREFSIFSDANAEQLVLFPAN